MTEQDRLKPSLIAAKSFGVRCVSISGVAGEPR